MNNDKKKQELFVKYLKNKYGEENLTDEKIKELKDSGQLQKDYQDFEKTLAKKAAHGTKLTYFKSLKHQCAEDEELYYYKKGGAVECGCKKKEGGEVETAKYGAVAKFKKVRKGGFGITAYADAVTNSQGFANAKNKKKEQKKKTLTFQGKPQMIIGKDIQKGSGNDTSEQEKKDKSAKDYYSGKQHIQGRKCGGSVEKKACGGKEVVKAFKEKCGAKMKKHQQGGSLNGIPFYQRGTNKGGIKEKSDNTRVQRIPNNGEAIYEATPQGYGDFIPLVGTWRAAQRIDKGEPNASYGDLIVNGAMDALGAGMVGSVVKAGLRANRAMRTAKSLGYRQITNRTPIIPSSQRSGTQLFKIDRSKMVKPTGSHPLSHVPNTAIEPTYIKTPYGTAHIGIHRPIVSTRTIPNVDLTPAVMAPLAQTLRVPATAPFK